jgi:hypothetical protein
VADCDGVATGDLVSVLLCDSVPVVLGESVIDVDCERESLADWLRVPDDVLVDEALTDGLSDADWDDVGNPDVDWVLVSVIDSLADAVGIADGEPLCDCVELEVAADVAEVLPDGVFVGLAERDAEGDTDSDGVVVREVESDGVTELDAVSVPLAEGVADGDRESDGDIVLEGVTDALSVCDLELDWEPEVDNDIELDRVEVGLAVDS